MKGNRAMRKLRNNAGETIAETLVALLISALALVMLAGAISSTANMIKTSDSKMAKYYTNDRKLAEQLSGDAEEGKVTFSIVDTSANTETRTANCYLNDAFTNKPVVAYRADMPTT